MKGMNMKISEHNRRTGWLYILALLISVIPASGAESSTNIDQNMIGLYNRRVKEISKAGVAVVRRALEEEIVDEVPLTTLIPNPPYDATEGKANDLFQVDIASFRPQGRMPAEKRMEYLRRLTAAGELVMRKDNAIGQWLERRKDAEQPTLLDAMVVLKCGRALQPSALNTNEWRALASAKNPMCRMLAIMHVGDWATAQEFTTIATGALRDEYWHTRYLALNALKEKPLKGSRQALESFLRRDIKKDLPETCVQMEELLTVTAREILDKLRTP
jgi:hypothetical protein